MNKSGIKKCFNILLQKILKSNWSKNTENKIHNHDRAVQKNWNLFKKSKLDLPFELREHLKKFSERHDRSLSSAQEEKIANLTKTNGEFSDIIKSYYFNLKSQKQTGICDEPYKNQTTKFSEKDVCIPKDSAINNKNHLTLTAFKKNLEYMKQIGKSSSIDDVVLEECKNNSSLVDTKSDVSIVNLDALNKKQKIAEVENVVPNKNHLNYPQKISIPKNKIKTGCVYRLNDCFYDTDGDFLYRVPGLEK